MFRQRKVLLVRGKSYAALTKRVLPPECIICIEDMDGNELCNRQQRRIQGICFVFLVISFITLDYVAEHTMHIQEI